MAGVRLQTNSLAVDTRGTSRCEVSSLEVKTCALPYYARRRSKCKLLIKIRSKEGDTVFL